MTSAVARLLVALTAIAGLSAVILSLANPTDGEGSVLPRSAQIDATLRSSAIGRPPVFAVTPARPKDLARPHFAKPPSAGLLIDLNNGRVLWSSNPTQVLPIASLTKMMNALVTTASASPQRQLKITSADTSIGGSIVGQLPVGHSLPVETLLSGMLIVSGNDAALALADGLGPGIDAFVARMNARARAMGLHCTHFETPTGLNRYDKSCVRDLARIATALLDQPRLARIVARASQVIEIPYSGKRIRLRNRNPLHQASYPGTFGVKTGHTQAAGWCLVAAAGNNHGQRLLGVLLHSSNTGQQMKVLLDSGFAALKQ
ncbi:MAG: serine hydrolase [Actinomycetes bacterium]